jgi:hypothetical protein
VKNSSYFFNNSPNLRHLCTIEGSDKIDPSKFELHSPTMKTDASGEVAKMKAVQQENLIPAAPAFVLGLAAIRVDGLTFPDHDARRSTIITFARRRMLIYCFALRSNNCPFNLSREGYCVRCNAHAAACWVSAQLVARSHRWNKNLSPSASSSSCEGLFKTASERRIFFHCCRGSIAGVDEI